MGMETWRRAVLAATAVAKAKNGTQLCVFGENQMMTGRPGRRVGRPGEEQLELNKALKQ